jgi:hypothetical protein
MSTALMRDTSRPSAADVLKEAARDGFRISLELERQQVLESIAHSQARAGDLDGAATTLLGINRYDRNYEWIALAAARSANERAAESLLALLSKSCGCGAGPRPRVLLELARAQARAGAIDRAAKTVRRITANGEQAKALAALGAAQWRAKNAVAADDTWRRACAVAVGENDEYQRAAAFLTVAQVRLDAGDAAGSRAVLTELAGRVTAWRNEWAKSYAWREVAVRRAAAGDKLGAGAAFRAAGAAARAYHGPVEAANRRQALALLAQAQARAGDFSGALTAIQAIPREPGETFDRIEGDEALRHIGLAELRSGRAENALRAAQAVTDITQFRDDIYTAVVLDHARHGRIADAKTASKSIENPSARPEALLGVALIQARNGDRRGAMGTAQSILLGPPMFWGEITFDYRNPRTWAVPYNPSHSSSSGFAALEVAGDVAADAMALHVALGAAPADFAGMFQHVDGRQLRKIAAAQVRAGDLPGALQWARAMPEAEQRAWACIGIAQALIDPSGQVDGSDHSGGEDEPAM